MEEQTTDTAAWRAFVSFFIVMGIGIGMEQMLPLTDSLRMQLGVLIVLLAYQFWVLIYDKPFLKNMG